MAFDPENLCDDVRREYVRWSNEIGPDDPCSTPSTLGVYDVLQAHFLIANYFYLEGEGIGGVGPKDLNMLHSAVYRQHVGMGQSKKWSDKFDICATLLYGIVMNHPFHDANKRTGFLSALLYLYERGRVPSIDAGRFEDFIVEIADRKLSRYDRYKDMKKKRIDDPEVRFISHYLRTNTRDSDKRFYSVTFRDLKRILNRFDCDLMNPQRNFIDVIKEIEIKKGIFLKKRVRETHRVANVAFPGWGRQVNQSALSTIRKATGLTAERGYDSQTFFHEVDTLESLIAHYQEPLRSLANR